MAGLPPQRENLWLNLGCNVAAPAIVLSKLSERLGPRTALVVALVFPLGYGIYDLWRRRTVNVLSALGFAGTLATGGLGLLKLEPFWFAVKDATVPALIGLTVVLSQWTKRPLIRSLLFSEQVIDVPRVEAALDARGERPAFVRLLNGSSWLLGGSFALSAVLNFCLARTLITVRPDAPEFNAQLGRMTLWSWPVIVLPSLVIMVFALWRLLKGIEALTGLTLDEILHQPPDRAAAPPRPVVPEKAEVHSRDPDPS